MDLRSECLTLRILLSQFATSSGNPTQANTMYATRLPCLQPLVTYPLFVRQTINKHRCRRLMSRRKKLFDGASILLIFILFFIVLTFSHCRVSDAKFSGVCLPRASLLPPTSCFSLPWPIVRRCRAGPSVVVTAGILNLSFSSDVFPTQVSVFPSHGCFLCHSLPSLLCLFLLRFSPLQRIEDIFT